MANALKKTVTDLPIELWRSLTWDRGKELSDHARFTIESGVKVSLLIHIVHGSAAQTKIRTAFYGNTSRKALTSLVGALKK